MSTAGVVVQRNTSSRSHSSRGASHNFDSDVVPDNIDLWNERSVHRSRLNAYHDGLDEDDAQVPESVRKVVSSTGHSLDTAVQRTMEDRMGEDFSDVQVHTGLRAAKAAEDINAKAFTVGNHVAFNRGEYDPSSAEGQHVIAHELAHVRQQTGGAVSMLPQEDVQLEIDPDPELEREAEETAQRVMEGSELGIQRLEETTVHVQRMSDFGKQAKQNLNDISSIEHGAGKLTQPLTTDDIEQTFTDVTGTTVILLKTDKWKELDDVALDGPGFNHIEARHVESGVDGFEDFAVAPGSKVTAKNNPATTFPPEMGPDEIKDAIEIAAKHGTPGSDPLNIKYSGPKLNGLAVNEMTVRRLPSNGNVITAYPEI